MESKTTPQLLTVSDVATRLAIKESTVRAWLLSKRISRVRIGRRAVRIPASEVERIISEGLLPQQNPVRDDQTGEGRRA